MNLKPSEIFYSQNNISNTFTGRHKGELIGETLDDIIENKLSYDRLPTITVIKKPGSNKWTTLDNRRLWIFHHLQARGVCDKIYVYIKKYEHLSSWDFNKFSSTNGGVTVRVRGNNPGGKWHRQIRPVRPYCEDPEPLRVTEHVVPIDPVEKIRSELLDRLFKIKQGCPLPIVPFYKRKYKEAFYDLNDKKGDSQPLIKKLNITVTQDEIQEDRIVKAENSGDGHTDNDAENNYEILE